MVRLCVHLNIILFELELNHLISAIVNDLG